MEAFGDHGSSPGSAGGRAGPQGRGRRLQDRLCLWSALGSLSSLAEGHVTCADGQPCWGPGLTAQQPPGQSSTQGADCGWTLPVSGAWHAVGLDTGTPGADTRPPTRFCRRGHGVQSDAKTGAGVPLMLSQNPVSKFSSKQQVEGKKWKTAGKADNVTPFFSLKIR